MTASHVVPLVVGTPCVNVRGEVCALKKCCTKTQNVERTPLVQYRWAVIPLQHMLQQLAASKIECVFVCVRARLASAATSEQRTWWCRVHITTAQHCYEKFASDDSLWMRQNEIILFLCVVYAACTTSLQPVTTFSHAALLS